MTAADPTAAHPTDPTAEPVPEAAFPTPNPWLLAWTVSAALAIASIAEKVVAVLDQKDDFRVSEDLSIYQDAVVSLFHGGWLYSTDAFRTGAGLFFIYPPFAAMLMAPMGYTETSALAIGWQVVLVALLGFSLWAIARGEGLRAPMRWAAALLGPAILLYPVASNFHYGQVNLVLLALVAADLFGVVPQRFRGVGVGLAAGIKLTPIGFVVVFAVRQQWRACVLAVATALATVLVGWIALPAESRFYWSEYAWDTGRAGARWYVQNQSVTGAMLRAGLDAELVDAVYPVVAAALVAAVVFCAWVLHRSGLETACVAVVGAGIALAAPMSFQHHWYWVVFLVVLAVAPRYRRWAVPVVVLLALVVVDPVQWFMHHDWSVRRDLSFTVGLLSDLVFLGTLAALFALTVWCARRWRAQRRPTASDAPDQATAW